MDSVRGAKVLVIEDDRDFLKIMAMALERAGLEVVTALDGTEGLRLFSAAPAVLVVTDIIMPRRDGLETILALRRLVPSVKIVAISGGARLPAGQYLRLAEHMGADAWLAKPFSMSELVGAAEHLLSDADAGPGHRPP